MDRNTAPFSRWFADRVVVGRVLAGLGGYLAAHIVMAVANVAFVVVGTTGLVLALYGVILLAGTGRGLGGCGLLVGGIVAAFTLWFYPFGPFLLLGGALLLGALALLALVPAPARNRRPVPRIVALVVVLVVATSALAFGAYEAWVLWPEAFSVELPLDRTWDLLRDDEMGSVWHTARLWSVMTLGGLVALLVLAGIPLTRFGARRILALGLGFAAAALVNLQLGAYPVGWNLTDYGPFESIGYPWTIVVRLLEGLLFTAALLIAAIRMPDEVRAEDSRARREDLVRVRDIQPSG